MNVGSVSIKPKVDAAVIRMAIWAAVAGLIHTLMCWLALELDFFRGDDDVFRSVFGVIWTGHVLVVLMFMFGVNHRFRDSALTMPLMLWMTFVLLYSGFYVDQIRLCIMAFFFAVIQMGAFTGTRRHFFIVATIAIMGYLGIILGVNYQSPESIELQPELIQWIAFSSLMLGYAVLGADICRMRTDLDDRNERLHGLVQRIEELAITDELTGAFNRRQAMKILKDETQMARRHGSALCVGYLDIDFFKKINDKYGHHAGDLVLKAFSRLIMNEAAPLDSFARLGGEEFLLVMVKKDLSSAQTFMEALREKIAAQRDESWPEGLTISASIGLAQYNGEEPIEELLHRADSALYKAKTGGRNRVVLDVI